MYAQILVQLVNIITLVITSVQIGSLEMLRCYCDCVIIFYINTKADTHLHLIHT